MDPEDKDGQDPASSTDDVAQHVDPEDQIDPADDDDADDEELYDKDGKPLPWANSKRFRKIYKDAKKGREVSSVLAEVGITPTELRQALSELGEYRAARHEWEAQKAQGNTDDADDAAGAEIRKREKAITDRLRAFGFVTKEDIETMRRESSSKAQANQVAAGQKANLHSMLKNEGLLSDDMDDDEAEEVMAEWDAKVGRRIAKSREDVIAFQQGDKRVVARHFKAALEAGRKRGSVPATKARPKIEDLPRRIGLSAVPKSKGSPAKEPQTIREAAAQMFAEMSGK